MKILVTGTNGFLGRALFGQLKKTSYTLFPIVRKKINTEDIECDIGNASNLLTVLNYYQPDIIINCAAKVDFTDNSMTGQYNVNAVAPTVFSYWCVENNAYLIQVSGSIVNGNTTTLFSNSSIESATSYYGKTKLLADRAIRLSKCDHAIIRFGGIFGEGGPDHLGVNRAINQARVGKIPTIIAKGKAMRNYIHVQDAAKLLVYCLDNRIIGTHYSGNHQSISISQMIYDICSIYLNNANPKRQSGVESVDQVVKVSSNFPKTAPFKKALQNFR